MIAEGLFMVLTITDIHARFLTSGENSWKWFRAQTRRDHCAKPGRRQEASQNQEVRRRLFVQPSPSTIWAFSPKCVSLSQKLIPKTLIFVIHFHPRWETVASIHDQYESREEKKSFNHRKSLSLSLLVLTFVVSLKQALSRVNSSEGNEGRSCYT